MQIITDPRAIPQSEFPFMVSKGGGVDIMSRLIRWRTNSWCEHSMLAINQGKFVWEDTAGWYGEGPMENYMKPGIILNFYSLVDINPTAIDELHRYVYNRIHSPWYHKMYDWVGILGEAVGLPKIHTPGLEYCSVDSIHALEDMGPALGGDSNNIIKLIPPEENPGYLDTVMQKYTSVFNFKYQYQCAIKP